MAAADLCFVLPAELVGALRGVAVQEEAVRQWLGAVASANALPPPVLVPPQLAVRPNCLFWPPDRLRLSRASMLSADFLSMWLQYAAYQRGFQIDAAREAADLHRSLGAAAQQPVAWQLQPVAWQRGATRCQFWDEPRGVWIDMQADPPVVHKSTVTIEIVDDAPAPATARPVVADHALDESFEAPALDAASWSDHALDDAAPLEAASWSDHALDDAAPLEAPALGATPFEVPAPDAPVQVGNRNRRRSASRIPARRQSLRLAQRPKRTRSASPQCKYCAEFMHAKHRANQKSKKHPPKHRSKHQPKQPKPKIKRRGAALGVSRRLAR